MTVPKLFGLLYWGWIFSEVLLQFVMRTRGESGVVKDRGSLLLLLPVIFGSIWAAMWYAEVHGRSMLGGGHWLRTIALAMITLGLVIRGKAIFDLGRSFSTNVAIHTNQNLRRTGLFRWVRHPSYAGMLLIFSAIGVYERNWVSLIILLLFPTAALLYRIHVEELALVEAFGDEYKEYSRTTSRLVPWVY